jgi:hypothetical protein
MEDNLKKKMEYELKKWKKMEDDLKKRKYILTKLERRSQKIYWKTTSNNNKKMEDDLKKNKITQSQPNWL